jgi:hypothetical protein
MHAPTNSHWDVVKRILRYLRGTVIYGISLTVPHLLYMVLQMQIGQIVLMIASLRVVILSSVGQTLVSWKSGKSIKLWQVALLRLSGFSIY